MQPFIRTLNSNGIFGIKITKINFFAAFYISTTTSILILVVPRSIKCRVEHESYTQEFIILNSIVSYMLL